MGLHILTNTVRKPLGLNGRSAGLNIAMHIITFFLEDQLRQ